MNENISKKDIIHGILYTIVFYILIDAFAFIAWIASGQAIPELYHLGSLSEYILGLFI